MSNQSTRQTSLALATVLGALFIVCFFWGYTISDPAVNSLHMNMLRMSFPGFTGLTLTSFILGLIQSVIWGLLIGWAYATSLNFFKK